MRPADVPVLTGVLARAYESAQNFEVRLNAYLDASDVATFIADLDGTPVGMVVGNDYGATAYVSQMAVDPALQRHGIGTLLMDALTAWADRRAFMGVELDATPSGAPLYARYGFVENDRTLVYEGSAGSPRGSASGWEPRPFDLADGDALLRCDAAAFGADRSDVLRLLVATPPNVVFVAGPAGEVHGYAVAQRRSEQLGPVVAPDAPTAARLIDAASGQLPQGHRISIPATNSPARGLINARAYRFTRSLPHMTRGRPPAGVRERLFARINLGQG